MTLRKIINKVHLVLGLLSGIVVFIVAITGAIWTFEAEISDFLHEYRTVEIQNKPYLKPSVLKEIARPYFDKKHIDNYIYHGANKAVELIHSEQIKGKEFYIKLFMNPYNGQILYLNKNEFSFFHFIIDLHVNLLMGETGKLIVDFATLTFLFLLITGIILWWPKNKSALRQRFKFNWKPTTKWKRKNYDLHNILGFYASWVVIFMAITGLAWGFSWMDKGLYFVASGGKEFIDWPEVKSKSDIKSKTTIHVEDVIYQTTIAKYSDKFEYVYFYFPSDKTESVYASINNDNKVFYNSKEYYYDQRTGDLLHTSDPEKYNGGEKLRSMYYDIHIGKILGLPGQFLVFFASLIVASLPVTGFMIWWGRRNKKKTVNIIQ
jgi:uncharacterized iron-regulated membrane protein